MNLKEKSMSYVKELVLSSDRISRFELAERAAIDIRTAASYAAALCEQGLAAEERAGSTSKGRPAVFYRPAFEYLKFIGIVIRVERVDFVLTDINSNVIKKDSEAVDLIHESKLAVVNRIFGRINEYVKLASPQKIGGIGIALTRWLNQPLAAGDIYHDIQELIHKNSGLPVFMQTPINTLTYTLRKMGKRSDNIITVNPGRVLEFGIQINGVVPEDARVFEYEFAHSCIEKNGIKCYCGKLGCLENYVTMNALIESYKKRSGIEEIINNERFNELISSGDPLMMELVDEMVVRLSRALRALKRKFNPLLLCVLYPRYGALDMSAKFAITPGGGFEVLYAAEMDVLEAAADMAIFLSVKNFIKKYNPERKA